MIHAVTMRALLCICVFFAATALADESVEKRIQQISELEKSGKRAEALERSIALIAEHPTDIPALNQLWMIQVSLGKHADARATVKRAKTITPNDSKSCNLLAILLASADVGTRTASSEAYGKESIALFVRAIELDPKNADPWFNLAVARTLQTPPDLPAAREAYKRAVELGAQRDPEIEKQIQWKP